MLTVRSKRWGTCASCPPRAAGSASRASGRALSTRQLRCTLLAPPRRPLAEIDLADGGSPPHKLLTSMLQSRDLRWDGIARGCRPKGLFRSARRDLVQDWSGTAACRVRRAPPELLACVWSAPGHASHHHHPALRVRRDHGRIGDRQLELPPSRPAAMMRRSSSPLTSVMPGLLERYSARRGGTCAGSARQPCAAVAIGL